ncbi:MAG: hypothetical protein SPL08_00695 [Pseudomonadota bacterium]|nr:hypothetical protein [Pseudomonadota bacterium]
MKKYIYLLIFCLLLAFSLTSDAWTTIETRRLSTYRNLRSVIFVISGPLLIILSLIALWKRKLWKVVRLIFVFLVVIATSGRTFDYMTRQYMSPHDFCFGTLGYPEMLSYGYNTSRVMENTLKLSENQERIYFDCIKREEEKQKIEDINLCVFAIFFVYLIYLITKFIFHLFSKILSKFTQKGIKS